MDNEINVLHALPGSLDERTNDKGAISRFLSDTSANASGSILYLYERMNARRCKIIFFCNTLWVGENRKIERGRLQLNLASLSIHGSVTCPMKSFQTQTMTVSAVCNNSPAETTTSDLSQLTTVLCISQFQLRPSPHRATAGHLHALSVPGEGH